MVHRVCTPPHWLLVHCFVYNHKTTTTALCNVDFPLLVHNKQYKITGQLVPTKRISMNYSPPQSSSAASAGLARPATRRIPISEWNETHPFIRPCSWDSSSCGRADVGEYVYDWIGSQTARDTHKQNTNEMDQSLASRRRNSRRRRRWQLFPHIDKLLLLPPGVCVHKQTWAGFKSNKSTTGQKQ